MRSLFITTMRKALGLSLCVAALCACDPTRFNRISDNAPVRVIESPDGYPRGGFGTKLATVSVVQGTTLVSRLAGTGGASSPVRVFSIFDGTRVGEDALFGFCDVETMCGRSTGTSIAMTPQLGRRQVCTVTGAPMADQAVFRCESGADPTGLGVGNGVRIPATPLPGTQFGAGLIAVPDEVAITSGGRRLRIIVSAPSGGAALQGALYSLRESEAADQEVAPLFEESLPSELKLLGQHMAITPLDATHVMLVASTAKIATDAASIENRAVVFVIDNTGHAEVRACLATSAATQSVIAAGDLNGDGLPEIAIADDPFAPLRTSEVRFYDGRGLPSTAAPAGTCPDWNAVSVPGAHRSTIECERVDDIDCTASGFGSSLAIADVNADGMNELLVGAPFTAVGATGGAGVVYVYRGTTGGAGSVPAVVLRSSDPRANGNLGATLATFQSSPGRHEIVAAETGGGTDAQLYVFLCSGLSGDEATPASPQCLQTAVVPMSDSGVPRTDAGSDSGS